MARTRKSEHINFSLGELGVDHIKVITHNQGKLPFPSYIFFITEVMHHPTDHSQHCIPFEEPKDMIRRFFKIFPLNLNRFRPSELLPLKIRLQVISKRMRVFAKQPWEIFDKLTI